MYGTHQWNASSSAIWFATAYSSSSIRLASFTSLISAHVVVLSFYSISTPQPFVVFLGLLECSPEKLLSFVTVLSSLQSSTISLMTEVWCPLQSNWECIFSAMTLTEYLSAVPSSHSTSYNQVSRSGLLCAYSIANLFVSVEWHFTVAMFPPLVVSPSSLNATSMYLSNIPMSSTSGCGSSIVFLYLFQLGWSYHTPIMGYVCLRSRHR